LDKELGVLSEVEHAYSALARGAEAVACGENANVDLFPGSFLWRLAKLAAQLAAKYPSRWQRVPDPYPDPCGGLHEALVKLAMLNAKRGVEAEREKARRAAVEWWRMHGATGAMHEAHLNLYVEKRDWEAQIAEAKAAEEDAKAEMYEAKGEAKAEAEARARADAERKEAEAAHREAEIALALWKERGAQKRQGRYGLTQQEVANQLGVTVRTVRKWEKGTGRPPGGYTRETRRNKATFASWLAGYQRDLSTGENLLEGVGKVHLGNRTGMRIHKGTK
jgi:DNA-binding transcriptional regulator YiaG